MRALRTVSSIPTPLNRADVDTDQIVPKQFLKLVQRTGFGRFLFYNWRYQDGEPNPDFVLNDPRYADSEILLAGKNFGCGSSREHAVWALADYGFSVVVAPSFADIFYSNCFKNGVLAITLDEDKMDALRGAESVTVDLERQTISAGPDVMKFQIDQHRRRMLLEGLDEIDLTLQLEGRISEFERRSSVPSVV